MSEQFDRELPADGFTELLGIEHLDPGDADARVRVEVSGKIRQPFGIVHGGAYSLLAETISSGTTAEAVFPDGNVALGHSNSATFLRPISEGHVTATGRVIHRGRSSWVWDIECADDDGRLAAVVRCVVAVRPMRSSPETGS
ncbi:MAG: PaaI family thioesterase [Solirubrobacterales bacterium]